MLKAKEANKTNHKTDHDQLRIDQNKWSVRSQLKELKVVIGNSNHAQHYLGTTKGRYNHNLQREKTSRPLILTFFEDARKQLEKISLNFSTCNPFPSWPSAAKDTCYQLHCTNTAIVNKTGSLFLVCRNTNISYSCSKRSGQFVREPL